jgi:hypothetical protein
LINAQDLRELVRVLPPQWLVIWSGLGIEAEAQSLQ